MMLANTSLIQRIGFSSLEENLKVERVSLTCATLIAPNGVSRLHQNRPNTSCVGQSVVPRHDWLGFLRIQKRVFFRSVHQATGGTGQLPHSGSGDVRARTAIKPRATIILDQPTVQLKAVKAEDVDKIKYLLEEKNSDRSITSAALDNIGVLLGLGAKRAQVVRLFGRHAQLFEKSSAERLQSKAKVFMQFGMGVSTLFTALYKSIDWVDSPDSELEAVLNYLDRGLGVNSLAKVATTNPQALGLKLAEVEDTVEYLDYLHIEDTGAAVDRNPALLGKGKADVTAKMELLRDILKMGESDVRDLVEKQPPLLLASSAVIRETHQQLVEVLGDGAVKALIERHPQILSTPWNKIQEPVTQLANTFGKEEAGEMIQKSLSLVRRKWESTEQKLAYLRNEMERSIDEIKAWPAALTFNLQTRLKPRYEVLKERDEGKSYNLRAMFGCNDQNFERRFQVALPESGRARSKAA